VRAWYRVDNPSARSESPSGPPREAIERRGTSVGAAFNSLAAERAERGGERMGFVDNPVITSPFEKPAFHYELDEEGQPTGVRLSDRRESIQIVPVPAARRRGPRQAELDLFGATGSKVTPNALINEIRQRVDAWRILPSSQWGVTPETQRLLLHWKDPSRARRLFFCQIEAIETLIYLTEVAPTRFRKQIEEANAEANPASIGSRARWRRVRGRRSSWR